MNKYFYWIIAIGLLAGCSYPHTTIKTTDDRPSIAVEGADRSAILVVDGIDMGLARNYDGKRAVLKLEPGTHRIEVLLDGSTVYSQTVFLGRVETKTISVGNTGAR